METKYDFSGYVTKNDILCSDGRTIRQNAFLENDGNIVPMVWMHRHDSPDNVLGHMLLENRPDGVYGYGFFNETPKARTAKALVEHGDISCMSIWANQLKQKGGDVLHGMIQEVSLVVHGANRGALIDSRLAHGDFSEDEAIICMGDMTDPPEWNEEEALIHYGRKGMKWGEHIFETEDEETSGSKNRGGMEGLRSALNTAKAVVSETAGNAADGAKNALAQAKTAAASAIAEMKAMIDNSEIPDKIRSTVNRMISEANSAIESSDAPEKIRETVNAAIKNVKSAIENAASAADDAADNAKSAVTTAGKTAADKARTITSDVKTAVNSGKDRVSEAADNLQEKAKNAVSAAKSDLQDAVSSGKEKTSEAIKNAEEKIDSILSDLKNRLKHSDNEGATMEHAEKERTVQDVLNGMTDEQRNVVLYLMANARQMGTNMKHSEEDETVKNNVFEQSEAQTATLSHADITAIFDEAKRNHGSLKDAFLAHSAEYGIENIEYLFPDDRQMTGAPVFIKKPDEWVKNVMANISHTPFARVRSVFADITEADARAKGYVKGKRKMEEVITLLKRKTDPTTVYKKQKLDRDDQVDITDLNVASWLKTEMRMKLDEEIAQGILIGDLRNPASDDKIDEQKLRPIWKDDDLFVIRKALPLSATMTPDDRARKFIRMAVKARKDYRGKGNPTLYTTEDLLTDMLMVEDTTGRPLYDSEAKLCTALRVKEIVAVPSMENVSRIVGTSTMNLMGIIVNLADYNVGADKGGSIEMFEDFDIDFNQNKYLIETRISGALVTPYSAIVIEGSESMYLDTDPEDPTAVLFGKNVSDLQSGIIVNEDSIAGTLKYVTGYTGFSGDPELQKGNFLALKFSASDAATTTVELLGGHSGSVTLDSDMNVVLRIENRNQKVKVVSAVDGMEIAKVYSLRLLKLNGPNA